MTTFGANTEDEAYQLYSLSTQLFAEGGFNLRKFVTNSMSLQQKIISHNQNPDHSRPEAAPGSDIVEENATYISTLFSDEMSGNQKILLE